ncbi:TPA: transcription antitermination factor NusB [Patescibacteria group bacterium]|uniref:Transcription antitermination protein NusB n=1 Tax=candidate division Kazan bacterium GW2011_GWA1_44_22 TaxID=1620410 RepID=A0A0G1I128_UNCK3|nr:MAG: N utilization substance protein B-like protein [candidate division Kazan bacterium GW2011_GWA1_44_22]HCR42314.1 transcription antitermination factor NusB [Patescibacteria group bacterium]
MASNRHFARIILMQSLYEYLQRGGDLPTIVTRNIANHDFDERNTAFINKIATGVQTHLVEIDEIITISAPEWPIPQIAQVDLSILRLAIFELLFDDEVPPKAVINEAVELSKAFGGENTSKFVNGVLGTVYRNSQKYQDEEANPATHNNPATPEAPDSESKPIPPQE